MNMPRKPASAMPKPSLRNRPGFSRSAITMAGSRPSATMLQRKKAIVNGGTLPATPRARIMLETWAVATSRKPSRPSASRVLLVASLGDSLMFDLVPGPQQESHLEKHSLVVALQMNVEGIDRTRAAFARRDQGGAAVGRHQRQ